MPMTKQIITGTKKQQQSIGLGRGSHAQIPNKQLPSTQQTNRNPIQKITGTPYTLYKTT